MDGREYVEAPLRALEAQLPELLKQGLTFAGVTIVVLFVLCMGIALAESLGRRS